MDEQTGNMDYDCSGNFSGIVDCDVVIFGGRQFLFILSISAKIKYGALCEVIYRDQICTVGLELPEIVPDRGGHSACFNFFGSLCFCAVALYRRKYGLMLLLVLQVFPNSMAVAGYYILIYQFGLVDSSLALIFVLAGGSAFNIWLLKSYIDGIPVELDEAAQVDGANRFQVFYKVILPLAMPQLAVLFLFSFIATYSEYVITSIFLQTPGKMTLALGLQSFISDQFAAHWTMFSAAAVISSLPIMIVFMCLQRFIQNGLVAGGVKG